MLKLTNGAIYGPFRTQEQWDFFVSEAGKIGYEFPENSSSYFRFGNCIRLDHKSLIYGSLEYYNKKHYKTTVVNIFNFNTYLKLIYE